MELVSNGVYVGVCRGCGAVVAAVVDIAGEEKRTAKDVADFIRSGYDVTKTHEVVTMGSCKCKERIPEQGSLGL